MKRHAAVLAGVVVLSSLSGSSPRRSWPIAAGEYVLRIAARAGSMQGAVTGGHVWLVPTSPEDRSPATGEVVAANLADARYMPLYGWTDVDLHRVGAPLCDDGTPPPTSRDPVFPGILVITLDPAWAFEATGVTRPKDGPILVMGTASNMRDGRVRIDGCGIGLFGQSPGRACIRGVWSAWGTVGDGRGVFELCTSGGAA